MDIREYSDTTDVVVMREPGSGITGIVTELEDDLYLTAVYHRGRLRETITHDPRAGGRIGRTKVMANARALVKEHAENMAARNTEQER